MYGVIIWKDHAVTPDNLYKVTDNGDGTVTAVRAGTVIQQGTNMNAANFNNLEQGVLAANLSAAEALRVIRDLQDRTEALKGLKGLVLEATLTNSSKYPFNNSQKTIALGNENERYNTDYTVIVEAEAQDGFIGDIKVSDKMLNGFKLEYSGSAKTVNVKCYVQGGR
ncbi:hypothetical protein EI53_01244 [Fusobacterium naviforme]|nr:hypothetical protein F7P78_06215 [Fusobacterium naviforme]PSL10182.1 hypothetical protein EI53_01244 [Fusobacterium naviforme]STO27592.1 Uncharacterised protein [Fusobacterium naviforme]